jgi:hypothetical protein
VVVEEVEEVEEEDEGGVERASGSPCVPVQTEAFF